MAKRKKQLTRGERIIAFIEEYCIVPDGALVGQPMLLDQFQKDFILDIYDNPVGTRRAYLSVARKNGKTGLIAGIVLAHLAGPEAVLNTEIVSGAQSREQAALVFSTAEKMVRLSDKLSKVIRIVPSTKVLVGLARNVKYRALSAEGKTADGQSPRLAILDEVGQIRGPVDTFVDAIVTSQGAHSDPLLIAISTQAPNDNDLFSIWLDDARISGDKRIVCHLHTTPKKGFDILDKKGWLLSNPAMGTFRNEADIQEQAERAHRMPSAEPTFRN